MLPTRTLGRQGLTVSALGLGCMGMNQNYGPADETESIAFGIAHALSIARGDRLTKSGVILGTPSYMSPEQAVSNPTMDGRSDQYSLGCVVYEMLAGEPPFTGPSPQAIMARHVGAPVPPLRTVSPDVPPAIETAILRALAKTPAERFDTTTEFGKALTIR